MTEVEHQDIFTEADGMKWWVVNGRNTYGGLMFIDGYYYYARTSGEIVCNRKYGITKTNDLLPAREYTFDEEGKMIDPPAVEVVLEETSTVEEVPEEILGGR